MSKSIWLILAIGAAGAILLALIMQHLAEAVSERERSPYAAAVAARMGSKLVGRIRIEKRYAAEDAGASGGFSFDVLAGVVAGVNKRRLAEAAGQELWLGSLRAGERADAVRVTLYEQGSGAAGEVFEVPPPVKGR